LRNTEKFIKKWEKDKQKGKFKYVLTAGIMTGTGSLVGSVIGRLTYGNSIYSLMDVHLYFASFLGGFIGGVVGSLARWSSNEEKYNHLVNNK